MSDLPPLPKTPPTGDGNGKPPITMGRIVIWVIVGGIGVFLLVSGIIGIIAKG